MMTVVLRPRQRKVKHNVMEKIQINLYRYFISLAILLFTLVTLFMSWGALELETFANIHYDSEPKYGTDVTCFFTILNELCMKTLTNIVYYGIRIDCIMSSPLILISFWFFWHESFGKYMLLLAHFCAWTKSISLIAVLACVMINEPSFMRETFEKSHFGSYESKLLYAFSMICLSEFFDICLVISLVAAFLLPDTLDCKYRAVSPKSAGAHRFQQKSSLANITKMATRGRNTNRISVVEAFPIEETNEPFRAKSNPV